MDLTPGALRDTTFRGALRGYNVSDVDEFVERVAVSVDELIAQLRQASARTTAAERQAASAAAVLLAAGTPGKRFALPHARVLLHQPYGGAAGQAADIEIQAKEILRMRDTLDQILSNHTGNELARVKKDTDRDFIMSADEAKSYGIIDEVIRKNQLAEVPVAAGVA